MNAADLKRLNPPDRPGVYLMRDDRPRIIYVGKALSLRKRLASYFRANGPEDPKTQALVARIDSLEFIVTNSELDALILESTLIKKHRPRYNVFMRDDKSYPYLKLTVQETYPRLVSTRKPFVDEARYFGPFLAGSLKETTRTLSRHFRLCQVKQVIDPNRRTRKTCLYYQMGQCDGACLGQVSAEAYARKVRALLDFLEGGPDEVSPHVEERMRQAAGEQQFEKAAGLRDQLGVLQSLRHQTVVSSTERNDYDLIGLARSGASAGVQILHIRQGKLEGRRQFHLQAAGVHALTEILAQTLTQYYSQPVTIPPVIMVPQKPEDEKVILAWLATQRKGRVALRLPRTREARQLMKMAETNAWLNLKQSISEAADELSEEDAKILKDLAARLGLSGPPRRVEGYDISNLSGQDAVGSRVVFTHGQPDQAQYRRYRIQSVTGPNDFAMLQEVLFRRLKRLKDEPQDTPDLIVVDGGAGQLSAVRLVLKELDADHLAIIGLAKKEEEIYLPGRKQPLALPKSSPALKFLMRLRDEAHRFAVSYHRNLRTKRMHVSSLDAVPGLGAERRRALLRAFGSVEALLSVTEAELAKVEGIGPELAKRIQQTLRKAKK